MDNGKFTNQENNDFNDISCRALYQGQNMKIQYIPGGVEQTIQGTSV